MSPPPGEVVEFVLGGAARIPLDDWPVFRVRGKDANDLLSRLSTNDFAPLGRGEGVTTAFLTPEGTVTHLAHLSPDGDGLRAVTQPGSEESFPAWIDRYTFVEDCRVELADDLRAAWRVGTELGDPLASDDLLETDHVFGPVAGRVLSGPTDALAAALDGRDEPVLDAEAVEQLRVECGVPAFGKELHDKRHALEGGLMPFVSFTKGCYTGQEVVARQDTYDKVVRRLVGFVFAGRPEPGEALVDVGTKTSVTTVGSTPATAAPADWPDGPACLGFVGRKHADDGTAVVTASGLTGRVVELPFPRLRSGA
ncbi:MAG: hypothetical protein AAF533_04275 [Acidobacteriota bacterium]